MDVDVFAIRRMNLEALLAPYGGRVSALADRLDNSPSQVYLTQVLSDKTQRRMGSAVARKIELKLDLPPGWLDLINSPLVDVSERGMEVAKKFDALPEAVRARIESEIDTLYRYSRKD